MNKFRFLVLLVLFSSIVCNPALEQGSMLSKLQPLAHFSQADSRSGALLPIRGALLTTRFHSLEELKKEIQIEYLIHINGSDHVMSKKPLVRLTHISEGRQVTSVLKAGISENDFMKARTGGIGDKVWLACISPYTVKKRNDLLRVLILARKRRGLFGEGDVAFYDIAEAMFCQINGEDLALMPDKDMSEKGFINTFNHISSQAFMTSLFSEDLADFVADVHERKNLPELTHGNFSEAQLLDLENGPVDNYVDIINNEWGQELGKKLKSKYHIDRETHWTPELLENYLNDMQNYYSWAFQVGFRPFRAKDELLIRFSQKLNKVMQELSDLN